jgi:hydroxyethylthiazole kinase-like uncharacterized protein yjeF
MRLMPHPLFNTQQLRAHEARAQAGLPAGTLMQRAGRAAAETIRAQWPQARAIAVVCGPGNNGGDGYVCARELKAGGCAVACVALAETTTADARAARQAWLDAGGAIAGALPTTGTCDLIVDAMFGIGLARPLQGRFADAAAWMQAQRVPIVALDVPSGLDADRGTWVGGQRGVVASATITFLGDKPGLHTADGVDAAGDVSVAMLGVEPEVSAGALNEPGAFASVLRARSHNTHKGSFGSIAVMGGGAGMVGAPLLAARAALRLGAGRVYVECIGAPELRFDPQQPELMFRALSSLTSVSALVVGCGLGTDAAAQRALRAALKHNAAIVVDADALNLIAQQADLSAALAARAAPAVLTPHPLEAARLLATDAAAVQSDRVGSAQRLAAKLTAIVVLKGAGSVIAAPDARYWINPTGGPALATAGTGDVLAGMIGSLIAQGIEPLQAALAGVWLHGAAADRHRGDVGLVAGDVANKAARVLNALRRQRAEV